MIEGGIDILQAVGVEDETGDIDADEREETTTRLEVDSGYRKVAWEIVCA